MQPAAGPRIFRDRKNDTCASPPLSAMTNSSFVEGDGDVFLQSRQQGESCGSGGKSWTSEDGKV